MSEKLGTILEYSANPYITLQHEWLFSDSPVPAA